MTGLAPLGSLHRPVNRPLIRHFRRALGENWCMQPVSDGAGKRARGKLGAGVYRR